jgi:hypothetical protein
MTRFLIFTSLFLTTILLAACGEGETIDAGSGGPAASDQPGDDTLPDGPLGAGPYPIATLDITVTHPDIDDVVYTISCLGDTATVIGDVAVSDRQACLALNDEAVRSRLIEGAPTDRACTEQYGGSDEARIVGTIDDKTVDTTVDRANGCGIDDWDSLLAALLPNPIGVTE